MNTEIQKKIVEILESRFDCDDENFRLRDNYSGRGMYGKSCYGITGHSLGNIYGTLAECIVELMEENGMDTCTEVFIDLIKNSCLDNMGRDYIVYFPRLKTLEYEDEENEE